MPACGGWIGIAHGKEQGNGHGARHGVERVLYIAIGGGVGAVLRYWISTAVYQLLGRNFPSGTLVVNVLGSLLMGFLYVFLVERADIGVEWRAAVLIGLLGSFTTFSTFSIETLNLIESGEQLRAGLNIVLSIVLCLCLCWAGVVIGRRW